MGSAAAPGSPDAVFALSVSRIARSIVEARRASPLVREVQLVVPAGPGQLVALVEAVAVDDLGGGSRKKPTAQPTSRNETFSAFAKLRGVMPEKLLNSAMKCD